MLDSASTPDEQNSRSLVGLIFKDLQVLAELQIRLTRSELQRELRRRTVAISILALGAGMMGMFAILAAIGSVHFLHWATVLKGNSVEAIPLWACYAIVASTMAIIGCALCILGVKQFHACSRLKPDNVTKEILP